MLAALEEEGRLARETVGDSGGGDGSVHDQAVQEKREDSRLHRRADEPRTDTLTVMLCDQHGRELDSLQDEDFSVCLCVQVEP